MLIANVQISFGEIKQLECYVLIGKMWIFKKGTGLGHVSKARTNNDKQTVISPFHSV